MSGFSKSHYEWLFYAEGYLGLAKIGCLELLNQYYRDNKSLTDDLLYGSEVSDLQLLLIPIFFNIKHSLELFIKGTGVALDKKYLKDHNIDLLLKDFRVRLSAFPELKSDLELDKRVGKLEPIIKKYFLCEFFKNIKGASDFQNELFRYPESRDPALSELTSFYKSPGIFDELRNFQNSDLQKILEDIKDIHNVFALVRSRLGLIKLGLAK